MATIIGTLFGIFIGLNEGIEEAGVNSNELVKTEVINWKEFFGKEGVPADE